MKKILYYLEHSLRLSGPDTWYLTFKSFVMQWKETGVERVHCKAPFNLACQTLPIYSITAKRPKWVKELNDTHWKKHKNGVKYNFYPKIHLKISHCKTPFNLAWQTLPIYSITAKPPNHQTAKRPNGGFCDLAKRFSLTNQPEAPTWFSSVLSGPDVSSAEMWQSFFPVFITYFRSGLCAHSYGWLEKIIPPQIFSYYEAMALLI